MAAFPYKLYGGATREDAISGLNPAFQEALLRMYAAAPPEVQAELGLNSAYRSVERQKELWDASDKSGKMVAAPGKSRHNHGDAVDLYGFGLGGGKTNLVSQATRDWVKQNAATHGFSFPMDYEPWHMQLAENATNSASNVQGPAAQTTVQQYAPEQRRNAIASIESAGSGDYAALGPVTNRQGDRAYGRYQIMASNIPSWSKEVLGREVSPEEFLRDPKIQDAIFDAKFGKYVAKYGERGAAQAWFGGEGNVGKEGAEDILGTNVGGYGDKYLAALGAAAGDKSQPGGATPAAPAAPAATVVAEKKDPLKEAGDKLFSGLGAVAGGGPITPLPTSTVPKIPLGGRALMGPQSVGDTSSQDQLRNQLSVAMARLNSGKLWG